MSHDHSSHDGSAPMDDHMDHMDHGSHAGHDMMSHMMSMSFHFGCEETVLFSFWKFSSYGGLIGSMIGIFILAVLYEGLKYYREHLFWRSYSLLQYRSVPIPGDKTPLPSEAKVSQPLMFSKSHGFQTLLHVIQIVISYFLMLIFMTYNVWLGLAVALGSTTGFFLFGWKKSVVVDVTEHCH
ncbi:high affinity copper uptake protein 1 isoform X2 [Planococcus citri]|uniref:high affinity copper uptake protein 1 isoform X2 n=1 Tax=Planococcus citri TaxID=170843 RepID=UPI0031F801C7